VVAALNAHSTSKGAARALQLLYPILVHLLHLPTAPAAATPAAAAASNIPAKFPCCGHPEPSASPLGSEGAGPSSAPNELTVDTSHHVRGNSNSDSSSSSTQPLSGFSDLHSNYKTID
jgi:hypothetical protein